MTWRSFIDYWLMREMGQEDAILRNYDVGHRTHEPKIHMFLALNRIGFKEPTSVNAHMYMSAVGQQIANIYGCARPDDSVVRTRLVEWYTWHRIRHGEIYLARRSGARKDAASDAKRGRLILGPGPSLL